MRRSADPSSRKSHISREARNQMRLWTIIEGLIPNIGISSYNAGHRSRLCVNPILKIGCRTCVEKLEGSCLSSCRPTLFNLLPTSIKGLSNCDITKFKNAFDLWFQIFADQPLMPWYTSCCCAPTYSIRHMLSCVTV